MSLNRRCSHCRAPLLEGRADCWSCGVATVAARSAVAVSPADVPPAAPCPNCGNAFAAYLEKCPECGAAGGKACLLDPPSGWKAERTDEGLGLHATWIGRLLGAAWPAHVAAGILALAIFGGMLLASREPSGRFGRRDPTPFVLAFAGWGVVLGGWAAFGRHSIHARPDFLRIETGLGPFNRIREFRAALFRIEEFRSSRSRHSRLVVEGVGGRGVLIQAGWMGAVNWTGWGTCSPGKPGGSIVRGFAGVGGCSPANEDESGAGVERPGVAFIEGPR